MVANQGKIELPNAEEAAAAIKAAKNRDAAAEIYAGVMKLVPDTINYPWRMLNQAILDRWHTFAALEYIKHRAHQILGLA